MGVGTEIMQKRYEMQYCQKSPKYDCFNVTWCRATRPKVTVRQDHFGPFQMNTARVA